MGTLAIEAGLVTLLNANAPLIALVGARIYPQNLPEKSVYPAIAFFRVSGPREHSLAGFSHLARARMQFDCIAKGTDGYKQAKTVARALANALDSYRGVIVSGSNSVKVEYIFLDNEEDFYTEQIDTNGVTLDFLMMYQE